MLKKQTKSKKGVEKVKRVMREFHKGELRDKAGKVVTDIQQAQAIAMSEAKVTEGKGAKKRTFKGKAKTRLVLKKKSVSKKPLGKAYSPVIGV